MSQPKIPNRKDSGGYKGATGSPVLDVWTGFLFKIALLEETSRNMNYSIKRETPKHPETPAEFADALSEWYENAYKGMETLVTRVSRDPSCVEEAARHWHEKGKARLYPLIEALRRLEKGDVG